MENINFELFFSGSMGIICSLANLAYWLHHKNGKRNLRLLTAFILMYFGVNLILIAIDTPLQASGHVLLRQWIFLLFLIPVWDLIVDWSRNKDNLKKKKEGRLWNFLFRI